MARPRTAGGFTITQLKNMLESRQTQLDELERERGRVVKQLAAVDEKIRALGGTGRGGQARGASGAGSGAGSLTAGGRARNPMSLVGTLEEIFKKTGTPMNVGDIVEAVRKTGYQSNSANFRAIVNQTLIKERKRFENTGRGMYSLK